jgi:hypothetical protein
MRKIYLAVRPEKYINFELEIILLACDVPSPAAVCNRNSLLNFSGCSVGKTYSSAMESIGSSPSACLWVLALCGKGN